jgi:tetratricopeptide (TPR) repeat protein
MQRVRRRLDLVVAATAVLCAVAAVGGVAAQALPASGSGAGAGAAKADRSPAGASGPGTTLPPSPASMPGSPASTCVQDDPVLTPRGWHGWDRSAVIAWEAVERAGGIVPEIEEDRTQAPPRWWRYPSALRSATLLEAEAGNARTGLYSTVPPATLAKGDILVRPTGAGTCGKMAVVGARVEGQWTTIEADPDDGQGAASVPANPLYFTSDGRSLRAEVRAFRIRVRKDDTIGHIRELERDLDHLEPTIGDRPLFLAPGDEGREVVSQKVHDLIDEAWSLVADESYDLYRRELVGRAWVLAAYLDWPAARVVAAAVLDDVLQKAPGRPAAAVARASLALLEGDFARGAELAQRALASPEAPARAWWVQGRALAALGRAAEAQQAVARFRVANPRDVRARQPQEILKAGPSAAGAGGRSGSGGGSDRASGEAQFVATRDGVSGQSAALGFRITWPLTWRVLGFTEAPETGALGNFLTGRVLLPDGRAERGAAVLLAQRPVTAAARASLVREGARKMFPGAKLKALPPVVPGSRREQFRERQDDVMHAGEVTTIERGGTVYFLVLNAPEDFYPKLREQYLDFVRSLTTLGPRSAGPPAGGSGAGGAPGRGAAGGAVGTR